MTKITGTLSITTRSFETEGSEATAKGSRLTIREMDENFLRLEQLANSNSNDNLIELLIDNFDEFSGDYYIGSEKIMDILKFDPTVIFEIIEEEDIESLKEPLFLENYSWVIYSGRKFGSMDSGVIMVNGLIFPQGGDIFGPGNLLVLSEENSYLEYLNTGFISLQYGYGFENDVHLHVIDIDAPIFGIGKTRINVELPNEVDQWDDENFIITISGLSEQ